jgi:glycosyltransferase involved in cell wall biosynthesis
MRAVFLIINYMPHQLVTINTLIETYQLEIHSIAFKNNTTPPENTQYLKTYNLEDFSRPILLKTIVSLQPEIMVVAGWAVPDFVWAAKQVRKKLNIPVVSYSDTQWMGTWRQQVNTLISPWHLKNAFTHLWVAGMYQYEYARRLGFAKHKIIYNSLSCDLNLFKKVSLDHKLGNYPKNFLFVGRFVEVKGLDILLNAWKQISDKKGWTLTLIGQGHLKDQIKANNELIVKDFMPQAQLLNEMAHAGCFVLPSTFEPWALVLHEAAVAGLPIISTNVCGAASHFVIPGYNGYQVNPNIKDLKEAMEKIIDLELVELIRYSKNSQNLGNLISPEFGGAQLMSVIK